MEFLSIREKKIRESLDVLFSGLDDETLKSVLLYTALGKSEEEKDELCERIRRKNEEDAKYLEKFELTDPTQLLSKPMVIINGEMDTEHSNDHDISVTPFFKKTDEKESDVIVDNDREETSNN